MVRAQYSRNTIISVKGMISKSMKCAKHMR